MLAGFFERYANHTQEGWSATFTKNDARYALFEKSFADAANLPHKPLTGSSTYTSELKQLHLTKRPSSYLEIGINHGDTLLLGSTSSLSVGVDPLPRIRDDSFASPPYRIFAETSDEFFARHAKEVFNDRNADLVFIDGLHIFEYVLRDFIGSELCSSSDGTILIHDILPRELAEAARFRFTASWTGDVWRILFVLNRFRPDLDVTVTHAHPTGLAKIQGLDPNNRTLVDEYDKAVEFGLSISSRYYFERRDQILSDISRVLTDPF